MSANIAQQEGRVQLDKSDMCLGLNIATWLNEDFHVLW